MLTLFTCPKPFRGHIGIIQRNAITSWTLLTPRPEIIILGDEEGSSIIAEELGLQYVPEIPRNEFGTPLLNGIFNAAQRVATQPILCYINADIILVGSFTQAVKQVSEAVRRFLIVGRRWDYDLREPLEFAAGWESRLVADVKVNGKLHNDAAIDYFVFSKDLWGNIPPFAIGRSVWDNWLLYRARARKAALVDVSQLVTAVHQNHDYSHHPYGARGIWTGKEAQRNQELTGGRSQQFLLSDATHELTHQGLRRTLTPARIRRHLVTLPVFYPRSFIPSQILIKSIDLAVVVKKRIVHKPLG